jgi:hypothetical protein
VADLRPLVANPAGPSQITLDVYAVAPAGQSWTLTTLGQPGAVLVPSSVNVPAWQRGGLVVLGEDGGMLPTAGVEQMFQAIWATLNQFIPQPPQPTHSTPMENITWDGSDRHHISPDTTNQDVIVDVPDPTTVVNRELTVTHRSDGGTGNTVRVAISETCPHQADVILAVGQSVTLRAIYGSYDIL